MSLENIRVVTVRTFHPGNIGAIARAMKNMGLSDLVLVNPSDFPSDEATSRAAGAVDVVENAKVVNSIEEAIADCQHVYATSARRRGFEWPMVSARQGMQEAFNFADSDEKIAILFGPERSGLESHELRMANHHVYIPANPEYDVLNVSAAAQLLCYELWMASLGEEKGLPQGGSEAQYPTQQEMRYFYEHLEETFKKTGFIIPQHPGKTMVKLKRLFNRAKPEKSELNILRGMLSSIDRRDNDNEQS